MVIGSCPVSFVRGEAYEYKIRFDDNVASFVDKVCISCSSHNFCHYLTKNEVDTAEWKYLFSAEETIKFKPIRTSYSLTIHSTEKTIDPQILTEQLFEVRENSNPCCDSVE